MNLQKPLWNLKLVSFDSIFTIGFHMNSTVKLHLDLNSIVMGDLTNQSVEPRKERNIFSRRDYLADKLQMDHHLIISFCEEGSLLQAQAAAGGQ